MVLWFVGPSVLIVWAVFSSPAADYRFVALGSLVPLLELPVGEPRALHSLTGAAVVLVAVMLGARGRRLVQRRLLGIPIGMLLHLVLDGAWTDTHAFWWPFAGAGWSGSRLPELGRGGWSIVLELARRVAPGSTAFVELAPVDDPDAVATTVADALGIAGADAPVPGTRSEIVGRIVDALAGERLLLVLDNCEHVVEAAAKLTHSLLEGCPDVSVVASSREALGVPGELVHLLPPLERAVASGKVELLQMGGMKSAAQVKELVEKKLGITL